MGSILLMLAVMVAGLFGISMFVKWYTDFCYRAIVTNKDDVLERVLDTRDVPQRWRIKWAEGLSRALPQPIGPALGKLLIRRYARRIDSLTAFVKANRRAPSDQKSADAETLKEIQQEWLACDSLSELL